MREKVTGFNFSVKWVPGNSHYIADALSRAPLFSAQEEEDITIDTALSCLTITNDPAISTILSNIDSDYVLCRDDVVNNTLHSVLMQSLKGIRDQLSVTEGVILLDAKRIVVPLSLIHI